jgi:uncharacterized protein (TIGR02145 family)
MMKKLLFLFFLPLWGFGGIAHASVTVKLLATDFPNKQVTLRVEYANAVNDRAWVWIALCSALTPGVFQPAEISAASATSGSVLHLSTNKRGFFVTASPATVTATLGNAPDNFSCCIYGSDAPPNATVNNGTYTFKGSPPFTLVAADGAATQTVTGNTLPAAALTITPVILTDETGYSDVFDFCLYTGNDLFIDATHFCQPRTSGAQNWEAWILDRRDNELYRIVYMPDNKWWLAQNVRYAGTGTVVGYTVSVSGCTEETCGRFYTTAQFNAAHGGSSGYGTNRQGVCPSGWVLPVNSEWQTFHNALGSSDAERISRIRALDSGCSPITNYFGFANPKVFAQDGSSTGSMWASNDAQSRWYRIDHIGGSSNACNRYEVWASGSYSYGRVVRCFRNL